MSSSIFFQQKRLVAATLLLLFGQWWAGLEVRRSDTVWIEPPAERLEHWNPTLARIFSFGHVPALVDWLWIRSLQDPSIFHVPAGVHPPIYYDLILATELDPAFREAYIVGANLLAVIRDDRSGSLELAERADRYVKNELPKMSSEFRERFWEPIWSVPLLLAYLHLFEFNDLPNAAKAFIEASRLPGSPRYLASLSRRLSTRDGHYEVAIRLIQWKLESEQDDRVREGLERKLFSLRVNRFLHLLNQEFRARLAGSGKVRNPAALQSEFRAFLVESGRPATDPFGGELKLDATGRIITTTERDTVLGMED